MLIIFDLDDTLIDTSGCITPFKLQMALKKMVDLGLEVNDFEGAHAHLKKLDAASQSSQETLFKFLESVGAEPSSFLEEALIEMKTILPSEFSISTLEGAGDVLRELRRDHQLALVTIGNRSLQLQKIAQAKIDPSLFSRLVIVEKGGKKDHYQTLMRELNVFPESVIVCGDRIAIDLTPAKELGLKTVHMRWGRGLNSKEPKSDVDYSISRLNEMNQIVKGLL